MLNLFKYCFDCRIQSHFQHLSITENCILCFYYYHLLNYHIQNIYENDTFQIFSCHKHLISSLNFCKLLIKQVFKILYYLAETLLLFVVSYYIYAEQCIFSAILTFITYSFSFYHHNLLLCEQKCVFL